MPCIDLPRDELLPDMSRTKGSKDKKPRALSESSLANIPIGVPGCAGKSVWVYGGESDIHWFASLSSRERGRIVSAARAAQDFAMDEPDLSDE